MRIREWKKARERIVSALLAGVVLAGMVPCKITWAEEEIAPQNVEENERLAEEVQQVGSEKSAVARTGRVSFGGNLFYELDNGVLTISGSGAIKDYSYVGDTAVPWANVRKSITKIVIGPNITRIGEFAFSGCTSVESVEFSVGSGGVNQLTSIGGGAFMSCNALRSIVIPANVVDIELHAFEYCSSLESVTFAGSKVKSIGDSAFSGCEALRSIEIPASVISIESRAFLGCEVLQRIEIPASVTSIGSWAFSGCKALQSIEIPASVTSIGAGVFVGCNADLDITVAEDSTAYAAVDGAVYTKNMEKIIAVMNRHEAFKIPDSVKIIGADAFYGCDKLVDITLPSNLVEIGPYAFAECTDLESVYNMPRSVKSIGEGAFSGCKSLGDDGIYYGGNTEDWKKIKIGENNREIEGCIKYSTIYPDKVVLNKITATEKGIKLEWSTAANADSYKVYRKEYGTTQWIENGQTREKYWVDEKAESGKTYSYTVTGLATDGTESEEKDEMGLSTTMPYRTLASGNCGANGANVVWVLKDDGMLSISGSGAMKDYASIYDKTGSWKESQEFQKTIKSVVIGEGVTSVGNYAFHDCEGIETVVLPSTVVSIGDNAFKNCSNLKEIDLPEDLTSLGKCAFYECRKLKSVKIPGGVESINYGTFRYCEALASVELHSGIKRIESSAFHQCLNLGSIDIPLSAESVDAGAFSNCYQLSAINYAGSTKSWEKISGTTKRKIVNCALRDIYGTTQENVAVELTAGGKKYTQSTVDDGGFVFMNLPTGKCTLRMEKMGYVPYSAAVNVTADVDAGTIRLVQIGDVNGDGSVDALDMACLYERLSTGSYNGQLTDEGYQNAVLDVNGDGMINILDYQKLYVQIAKAG